MRLGPQDDGPVGFPCGSGFVWWWGVTLSVQTTRGAATCSRGAEPCHHVVTFCVPLFGADSGFLLLFPSTAPTDLLFLIISSRQTFRPRTGGESCESCCPGSTLDSGGKWPG